MEDEEQFIHVFESIIRYMVSVQFLTEAK